MKALCAISFLLVATFCCSAETKSPSSLELDELWSKREPIGSRTDRTSISTNSDYEILWHMTNYTSGSNWIMYAGSVLPLPYAYRDASGITFYVESDGRHVSAIDTNGNLQWTKDTLSEPNLEFFRTNNARINYIRRNPRIDIDMWKGKSDDRISVRFSPVERRTLDGRCYLFGILDVRTGDFAHSFDCY